ncbi:hypothetical protein CVIRNUC_010821 [Coccomyxa viridis]|uniref:FAD-binding domain-containing protein n=1 Tax=Coccomyxa viridis TaxID=1274662 RepID=A0AAV1IKD4_9CHLO|nr:hypothetical protein CVIRNUC_010821 [Coccomyxa viridis]
MTEHTTSDVIIVGGSCGGLACAHALLGSGKCRVTVLERAPSITAAGAGLGLGQEALSILRGFGLAEEVESISLPLPTEVNTAVCPSGKTRVLQRDDSYNHRSLHWSDLHQMLLSGLPLGTVRFSHIVTSRKQLPGSQKVTVTAERHSSEEGAKPEQLQMDCDLLVAADGSMSATRALLRPNESRRYSGYCAWRGVVTDSEAPEAAAAVRRAYQALGTAIYFEIAEGTHGVLYELPRQRLNWLWYVNQEEPELKGHSVTVKAGMEQIQAMRGRAAQTFRPEMAQLLQATPTPFINAIYDREPLQRLVQGRIVLVGEAAHPTTPHALRSTNMAIMDAGCLGDCMKHCSSAQEALKQYEAKRLPQTSKEVLFSRHLGRVKQALDSSVDWFNAGSEQCNGLAQANMSSFTP